MTPDYIITIGRQLGSGGREVAEQLAARLRIPVYDKRLLNVAAEQSGIAAEFFERADEKNRGSLFGGLLNSYLPFAGTSYGRANCIGKEELFKIQSDAIRSLAATQPAIFIGRCADYILRDHRNRLDLFLTASDTDRRRRIMRREGCTEQEADRIMESGDRRRAAYYNYYTGKTWGASASYHLCIDTSLLGIDATVAFVEQIVRQRFSLQ